MKKIVLALVALGLLLIVAPLLFSPNKGEIARSQQNLPWQIETLPDGHSKVFGLELGRSTMEDARRAFGPDIELAIVRAPGEKGSLEAYVSTATLGFVTGRLVFAAAIDDATLEEMASRPAKSEYMESTTRKLTLDGRDRPRAWAAPIRSISFIPSINLDEATLVQRFGPPAERLPGSADSTHLLYPDKGLDIILDAKKKELLQYVAPKDFALLRAPLAKPSAPAAEAAAKP